MRLVALVRRAHESVQLSDLTIIFAVIDAGLAYFVLLADGKPVAAVTIAGGGLALAAISILPIGERARSLSLLGSALLLGSVFSLAFVLGHPAHAPFHDSALLTDAAAAGVLQGRDPYGHDYLHSFARGFYTPDVPVNFGLGHYVYTPVNIILDLPLRALARSGGPDLGFQVMYSVALTGLAVACYFMGGHGSNRRVALTAISLNPLLITDACLYYLNDVFFLASAIASVAALRAGRPVWCGILFGLALATKQQAVLMAPFILLGCAVAYRRSGVTRAVAAATVTGGILVAPFLLWSPAAFLSDVAGFFYGSGVGVYPIRGASLPGLLLAVGLIPNRWTAFPSAWFQILISLPVLVASLIWLARNWSWTRAWLALSLFTALVFFLGRVLAPNYIDMALLFLVLALADSLHDSPISATSSPPPAWSIGKDSAPTGALGP